jgi:hypothetical protein
MSCREDVEGDVKACDCESLNEEGGDWGWGSGQFWERPQAAPPRSVSEFQKNPSRREIPQCELIYLSGFRLGSLHGEVACFVPIHAACADWASMAFGSS